MAKYSVHNHRVSVLLGWIESNNIAIPEMQRPFVWTSVKVRDLMDSLYRGFPVGYLITWQSAAVPVKGGGHAGYQQILIDGQQRITALRAAISGEPVVGKDFKKKRIVIAFNPQTETFATATPVIKKDPAWIADIHEFLARGDTFNAVMEYTEANPGTDPAFIHRALSGLAAIKEAEIGIISLDDSLDIETVTEIFVRINSKGVSLSSADFVMSKISAYNEQGRNIRKLIDYFAHLAVNPSAYSDLAKDEEFVNTDLWPKITWLKDETEDLYDPSYSDLIRVSSALAFRRGRLSSVVSELSGLDPQTRKFDVNRIPAAFDKLETALVRTVNEYDFKHFLIALKSAGFIDKSLLTSINAVNLTYVVYLLMREQRLPMAEVERVTRRWLVMLMLTGRAVESFETQFEADLRRIDQFGVEAVLKDIERVELSANFWDVALPQRLETSATASAFFRLFQAAQVKNGARAFLSKHVTVQSLLEQGGDIHHLVPKEYLRENGINDRTSYNQIANYAVTEKPVNIRIGKREPANYLAEVRAQFDTGNLSLGDLNSTEELEQSFREHAVPMSLDSTTFETFTGFLKERRQLMAQYLRAYYESL